MGGAKKEGTTTLGVKYDFRMSSFKAQVDSQGRLGCLLEKRVAPPVTVSFFGEIDHVKNSSRLGLAVSIENAPEEILEQHERGGGSDVPPPPF